MSLQFPTSPSVGTTYQSGSSATYTYNGVHWTVTTPKTSIAVNVISASWGDQRANVTSILTQGLGATVFIAEGKLYGIKSNNTGITGRVGAQGVLVSGSTSINVRTGIREAYLIDFPNETSSVVLTASVQGTTACALFDNGNLYTWGANAYGQLGLGYTGGEILEPALSTTNVTKVFTHHSSTSDAVETKLLIQKTDGNVYGCGYNGQGNLGVGDTTSRNTWTQIPGIGANPLAVFNVGGVNGGIIAQKSNGQVVACGYNLKGWLGDGSTTQRNSFVTASGWLGGDSTAVLKKLVGFTRYNNGSTVEAAAVNIWISGSAGQKIMFAGDSGLGGSGNGRGATATNFTTPVSSSLPASSEFTDVVGVGAPHSVYAWTGSSIYSWGRNDYGQLGYAAATLNSSWPSASLAVTGVVEILHGDYSTLTYSNNLQSPIFKLTDNNYYFIGGRGDAGCLGIGENPGTRVVTGLQKIRLPLSESIKYVGSLNTNNENSSYIAVTNDDRFYVWGKNDSYGSIDPLSAADFFEPVLITPQVLFK